MDQMNETGAKPSKSKPKPPQTFSGPRFEKQHFTRELKALHAARSYDRVFLVNSVPKSGSTFTMDIVHQAIRAEREYGGELEIEVEQCFSLSGIRRTTQKTGDIIYKFHGLPNFLNVKAIEIMEMGFINIARNLFDCMVSVDDHLMRGQNERDTRLWQGIRVPGYAAWDPEKRFDFIADFIMPFYIQYMATWAAYRASSIVYYEEMVQSPDTYFRKVEKRLGLEGVGLAAVAQAANKRNVRFNVGKIGRGDALRDTYMAQLRRQASFYPKFDYTLVGL